MTDDHDQYPVPILPPDDDRRVQARIIYDYLCKYSDEHGWPPSLRQIAKGCYMSRSNVVRYLDMLEAWGFIEREPNLSRAIRIMNRNHRL